MATDTLAAVSDDRLPVLVVEHDPVPSASNPYLVYLATLSGESQRTMRSCLDRLARVLAGVRLDDDAVTGAMVPWWQLRYPHTAALRAVVASNGWSPAHANKHLSALRRVLRESWRLGLMTAEDYQRAADLEPVRGVRPPAGRDVGGDELAALLAACQDDTPLGARDAAVIATMYATGMRRSEVANLDLADLSLATRVLTIRGKGNKTRLVPVGQAAWPWLMAWLRTRGPKAGPLFLPVFKGGHVGERRLTSQTVRDVLDRRGVLARLDLPARPHDLRRTLVGDLLDAGTDLVTVQTLAGHADPRTTSRYDRRSMDTKRDAVDALRLPSPD